MDKVWYVLGALGILCSFALVLLLTHDVICDMICKLKYRMSGEGRKMGELIAEQGIKIAELEQQLKQYKE